MSHNMKTGLLIVQAGLRTLGIAATLIAIALMVTSKERVQLFGFEIDSKYSYTSAFKFSVIVNTIACVVSVLSLCVFLYHIRLPNPGQRRMYHYFLMFVLDLVVVVSMVMGVSAAAAIGYVGRYGNSHAGWIPICDHFGKFCNKIMASISMSCVAVLLFIVLTIWSSWKATTNQTIPVSGIENNVKPRNSSLAVN